MIGNLFQNIYDCGEQMMADMDKLMEFLQKEVPSHAGDLNDSINNILETIERTHAALGANVGRLYQYKKYGEIRKYESAGEQLTNIENYLGQLVNKSQSIKVYGQQLNNMVNKPTISKPNYDSCKIDDTKPYNLDADFSKKDLLLSFLKVKNMMYKVGKDY